MNTAYRQPDPNYYRLTKGIQVTMEEEGGLAICDYPLRAVRLNTTDEGRLIYLIYPSVFLLARACASRKAFD